MSLKETKSTKSHKTIPRKCKSCSCAIYTKEDSEIYYQCNMFGKFKKDCTLITANKVLPKPEEILEK